MPGQAIKTRFWRRAAAVPVVAGIFTMAAMLLLASALRLREAGHIRHVTGIVTKTVQADIEGDIEALYLAPMRYSDLWNVTPATTKEIWQAKARAFLQEHRNFVYVEWAGSDQTRWSVPEHWAAATARETSLDLQAAAPSAGRARASTPVLSHAVVTANNLSLLRMVLPVYEDGRLQGIGTAAFAERQALDDLLGDVSGLGYWIAISEGGREWYRRSGADDQFARDWSREAELSLPGLHWKVRVWPTPDMLGEMQSRLPQFVLGMGLALSFLVALSTHFAQSLRVRNISLMQEIAERQRAQNALQVSQERLKGILDTSVDAVISVDDRQHITMFNTGAETIFGYAADEVMGKHLELLLPARFQQAHREDVEHFGRVETVRTKRMAGPREVFGRRKDGSEFQVEASISKLQRPEGTIYTAILRDVSERVQAREALQRAHAQLEARVQERTTELVTANELLERQVTERREAEFLLRFSEHRLQSILDNCTAVIFMKDIEGRYLLINRWYETLFHLKNEEVIGKTDYDIFPPEVAAALRANDQQVLQSQAAIEFEEDVVHPDGTLHNYIATKFLIRDAEQKPYAVCGISTDITRQKQSEALLSDLSGRLMQFQDRERQRVAHDLHEGTAQMLAALAMNLGMAQSLAARENNLVRSAIDVSLELVEQSTTQVKTMAYLLHPPGLDDFGLESALRWFAEGFSERSGIRVGVNISSMLERFDREVELAVFRILQEALTNVLRHSGSKSAEITLRRDDAELVLEISDHGRGIPNDLLQRMLSGAAVPGIGIAGIRERVRQLGGALEIHSSAQGLKLIARLPATPAPRRDAAAELGFVNGVPNP